MGQIEGSIFVFRFHFALILNQEKLQGWIPLLEGFIQMKKNKEQILMDSEKSSDKFKEGFRNMLENSALVLAGPAPEFVADDPEGSILFCFSLFLAFLVSLD